MGVIQRPSRTHVSQTKSTRAAATRRAFLSQLGAGAATMLALELLDGAVRPAQAATATASAPAPAGNPPPAPLLATGEREAALRHFGRALALKPDYAEAREGLAAAGEK